jgi:hypothetical protein
LLEAPDHLLAVGVLGDEGEEVEVPLGITDHAVEVVDLKEAEVTMIILDPLLLEVVALLGAELVGLAARLGALGPALMVNQERLAVVRALAIGTAGDLHLEHAEVDPELEFFPPVQADDFAHLDGAGLVRPILEQRIEIKTHDVNNVRNDAPGCQ